MINIMKAQLYQIKKDSLMKVIYFGFIVVQMLSAVLGDSDVMDLSGGTFIADRGVTLFLYGMMFMLLLTAQICGGDFMDKTGNYELMGGALRRDAYFARVILSVVLGCGSAIFLTVLPIAYEVMRYGWGNKVDVPDVFLRGILLLFPMIRMICEFVFLTFLIKNPYVVMGCSYFVVMFGMLIGELMKDSKSPLLGLTNVNMLCNVDKWATYGLMGDMNYIYDAGIGMSEILGTVTASVAGSALFLYLGYVFFKHDDMH